MARVWQRLAVAVVSVFFVLVLAQCKGLKQKPGDKCVSNGQFQCDDPSTALLCQNGTIVSMPCRGPGGCKGFGPGSQCDDDMAQAGEACIAGSNGANYACATDLKSELVCTAGKWTAASTCKGPKGCKINGMMVNCDDDFADINDPCQTNPGNDNYSCSTDKKTIVVCQNNKFVEWEGCHGDKGCYIQGTSVYCDTSKAQIGDMCRKVGNHSCSDDTKSMLVCQNGNPPKWGKQTDCKRNGCRVSGEEVLCN